MRSRLLRLAMPALAAVLLAACGGVSGDVAAVVNGVELSVERLERRVAALSEAGGAAGDSGEERVSALEDLQTRVLTDMILIELVDQEADAAGVTASDAEVDEAWEEQVALAGDEETLRSQLEAQGITEDDARQQLATRIRFSKLAEAAAGGEVTDADLRSLYEEQRSQFTNVEAAHILVETQEEATAVLDRLRAGEDFASIAQDVSLDTGSAQQGGQLPPASSADFVEPFAEATATSPIGEIVGPIQTQFGWHVLRVDSRTVTPFDEVQEELRQQTQQQRQNDAVGPLLQRLVDDAEIEVAPRFGQWDPDEGAVVVEPGVGDPAGGTGSGLRPQG